MNRQAEIVKQLTDKELLLNLYVSQAIFLFIASIIGFFYFDSWQQFFQLFRWEWKDIILLGGGVAVVVIIFDLFLYKVLPNHMIDDGGINERVFAKRPLIHILIISFVVAFCEEILFRGVLQNVFGYIAASLIFAIIHFRYLYKPILFIITVGLSFLLGWIFIISNNLFVPIFAHFLIDFVLGAIIMVTSRREVK